jgi:hypothetical protein
LLASIPNPGGLDQWQNLPTRNPCAAQRRIQPFWDCVAYLLAKRWLQDQWQQEETPPQKGQESRTEQPEP